MTLVGYKKMTIQVLDKDLKPVSGKKFAIEGQKDKGAASSFEITGLSKEATKVYGSNIPYFISQKGTGNVSVKFGVLDLPSEAEHEILGHTKSQNGVYHIGDETNPPYCAVLTESEDLRGQKVGFGMYVGKFGRDAISGTTLSDDDYKPDADEFTYTPIAKKFDDGSHTVGIADSDDSYTALTTELFGGTGE